jgi:hypothetical protein
VTTEVEIPVSEPVPTASLASMRRLAKQTAIETLKVRLVDRGIPVPEATAIARATVDPAEARRHLDRLTPVRVPGGTFQALDTLVWAPGILAYATNNREASARHYPAGVEPGTAEAARYRPLREPTDAPDGSARLELSAEEQGHLMWSLERSVKFLLENNDISTSIAHQGVLQHVTVVPIRTTFDDGSDSIVMLGTVDGSSRTTSAHHVLGLTPDDVVLKFAHDERAFRAYVSAIQSALDRPLDEVSEEDAHRLRALQVPARIFLDYEADPAAPVGFAKAVESYVHLIHVEPPKPWDTAASIDARAASVLGELEAQSVITRKRRLYLEGMYTPKEARAANYFGEADERALELVSLMSSEQAKKKRAVRTGVIVLSKAGQVRKGEKAAVAVELALRANRSALTRGDAKGAREALQTTYQHGSIWGKNLKPWNGKLEDLRESALMELENGGPGPACRQAGAQGAYWLAVRRVLREAHFFPDKERRDGRSPQRILDELMHSKWGIEVLYRAILDGRDGLPLARVDESGNRVPGISGEPMNMTSDWLRGTVVPPERSTDEGGGEGGPPPDPGPTLPTRMLLTRREALEKAVDRLEYAHDELRAVRDTDGTVLADKEGLPTEAMETLSERLDALRRQFDRYGLKWEARNVVAPALEPDDDLGSGDEQAAV